MATIRSISITCPLCGVELPPVPVKAETVRGDAGLWVNVSVDFLDREWQGSVYKTHPACSFSLQVDD